MITTICCPLEGEPRSLAVKARSFLSALGLVFFLQPNVSLANWECAPSRDSVIYCELTPNFREKIEVHITPGGDWIERRVKLAGTPKVSWGRDNVTRTTVYTYADKTTHSVSVEVPPKVTERVLGIIRTTTTTYGNPKAKPLVTRETGVLDGAAELTGDFGSKTTRYRFSDGTSTVVTTSRTKTTVTWASDNITRTTRYDYADKSTHVVQKRIEPNETVTWENNITKITNTLFANGKRTTSRVTEQPQEPPVQYSEAAYPDTWASGNGGVVTAPSVSARQKVYGNGHIEVLETGTSWQPFRQGTLSSRGISDPNSFVQSLTSIYDLRWGTPDPAGPTRASEFRNAGQSLTLQNYTTIAGYRIDGVCRYGGDLYVCGGPSYKRPVDDVLDAWDKGWTGKGTKILVIDSFGKNINSPRNDDSHGIYVSLLARNVSIGSEILTLDWSFTGNVSNAFGGAVTAGTLAAINMSFDLRDDTTIARNSAKQIVNYVSTDDNFFITGIAKRDAVLVKAAGNDNKFISDRGSMTAITYELIYDASAFPKTLIVGALDKDGSVNAKANKASYSNTPGSDSKFQNRFVMANGTSPFSGEFGWNNIYNNGAGEGTSFAAPRVAGYIGILRHKFPNLNAEKSSSIILDTARTDTLWCHPTCQASIVGRGEASLSRALAPVGRLR